MKKEAINTFSEGLNYDLNPITTPNNLLTDAVNGTFITFNGDELALQNDAGNTKIIDLSEDILEYVKLTDEFYPLGVKEYGGVLYIVSARSKIYSAKAWNPTTTYALGTVIKYEDLYYYAAEENLNIPPNLYPSILDEETGEVLLNEDEGYSLFESSEIWVLLGNKNVAQATLESIVTEEQLEDYKEYIEFGSYPSPELPNTENQFIDAADNNYLITEEEFQKLYSSKVINNYLFRPGEYVKFSQPNSSPALDTSNVSYQTYENGIYQNTIRKVYKVRLLLQLPNGFIDFTDNVWRDYALFLESKQSPEDLNMIVNYPTTPAKFWFSDTDFKYYCKSNYKGKLVIITELEELELYNLNYFSITQSTDNNGLVFFNILFNITYNNGTTWTCSNLKLDYFIDGISQNDIKLIPVNNGTIIYTLPISAANENKQFAFTIMPDFVTNNLAQLPQTFTTIHTLRGSEILSTYFNYDDTEYESYEYY